MSTRVSVCNKGGFWGWVVSCAIAIFLLLGCSSAAREPDVVATVDFDREVRPLLAQHCFSCHGPDASLRAADLRLDQASGLLTPRSGGRPAVVVPGNSARSLLYQRIRGQGAVMPPLSAKSALSAAEVELVRRWIDAGATYTERRNWVAPSRPTPPTVKHVGWVRNPIDAFIAESLEAKSLEPAPEAAARALIRRVTLALTGLPPRPEAVEKFAADPSDAAYQGVVDALLGSSAYGEQQAHYWLDVSRFADTHGFHLDEFRSVSPYRDYVIDSFNAGKPFDQFSTEQLAGDLMPGAGTAQLVATGFIRNAMSTSEPGAIPEEFAAVYAKDRVDTLAKTWLGLTVGCAACHDHKFDPITQREFYELTAFFRNSTQPLFDQRLADAPPVVLVGPQQTPSLVDGEAAEVPSAQVLIRGRYDQPGETVGANVPRVLPPLPAGVPRNRLGLAAWLFVSDHPLTARVAANRFWAQIFGVGLVRTVDDFGSTGEAASHPKLLDWLAVEFRESGWNIKRLLRLMVTSAAYRQSAVVASGNPTLDPENRLLWRGPRFRMDAELVRDLALAVSGLLVDQVGGLSVKPYQPAGLWETVAPIDSNTHEYQQDSGAALYRRSLYTFWKRSAPPASLALFDAPSRELSTPQRERTNTPLQALVTLNDVQFMEAARQLAAKALASSNETQSRLAFMAARVLSRPLAASEIELLTHSLSNLKAHYAELPAEASALTHVGDSPPPQDVPAQELAAWTLLANTFLNLDEALNQ